MSTYAESHVKCTDPDHHGCPLCTAPAAAYRNPPPTAEGEK